MITINASSTALVAQNNMNRTQSALTDNMLQLSTGKRINSAADDAAGMQITNRMAAQVSGLDQAQRNINDAISMAQTTEGALQETTDIINRMRDLSVQSASDSNSDKDRAAIQKEITALTAEVTDIANNTKFAGTELLAADKDLKFQVGADKGQEVTLNLKGMGAGALKIDSLDLTTQAGASAAIKSLDDALATVDAHRGSLGAFQNRMESKLDNLSNIEENMSSAKDQMLSADFADQTTKMTSNQMLLQSGASVLAQAKSLPQYASMLMG